jgi:hypothetical protein
MDRLLVAPAMDSVGISSIEVTPIKTPCQRKPKKRVDEALDDQDDSPCKPAAKRRNAKRDRVSELKKSPRKRRSIATKKYQEAENSDGEE